MIIQGCTSAYAIWSQLKQESKDLGHEKEIIAYKNVNVRLSKLVKLEYIIEIAPHEYTQHGRRDYKVTMKGFELLISYILAHPEDIRSIVEYMNKFDLDKRKFGQLLQKRIVAVMEVTKAYEKEAGLPFTAALISEDLKQYIEELENKVKDRSKITIIDPKKLPKGRRNVDIESENEFLHEMKLSMMPSNTTKKVTNRSNVKELELARNIAEIEVIITDYYENIRYLLRHHGIEIILEKDRNRNNIILKRSVPQRDESVIRSQDDLKIMGKSTDQSIERMKKAFPVTNETIKKLEEITYKINEFSLDKSVVVIEGITTTTKKQ